MKTRNMVLACGGAALALSLSACGGGSEPADSDASAEDAAPAVEEVETAPAEAPAAAEAPAEEVASAPADPIRGPGGLEEKCLDRVNEMVGGAVIGTNRIEEAESGVAIFVNVDGATAPWRCFGYRDGTIDDVMFTGDEGAL